MNYFMLKGMRDELEKIAGPVISLGSNMLRGSERAGLHSLLEHMALPGAKKVIAPTVEAAGKSIAPDLSRVNKTIDLAMSHNRVSGLSTRGAHKLAPAALTAQAAETPVKATVQKGPGFFGNIKNRLVGRGATPTQEFKPFEARQSFIPPMSPAY